MTGRPKSRSCTLISILDQTANFFCNPKQDDDDLLSATQYVELIHRGIHGSKKFRCSPGYREYLCNAVCNGLHSMFRRDLDDDFIDRVQPEFPQRSLVRPAPRHTAPLQSPHALLPSHRLSVALPQGAHDDEIRSANLLFHKRFLRLGALSFLPRFSFLHCNGRHTDLLTLDQMRHRSALLCPQGNCRHMGHANSSDIPLPRKCSEHGKTEKPWPPSGYDEVSGCLRLEPQAVPLDLGGGWPPLSGGGPSSSSHVCSLEAWIRA